MRVLPRGEWAVFGELPSQKLSTTADRRPSEASAFWWVPHGVGFPSPCLSFSFPRQNLQGLGPDAESWGLCPLCQHRVGDR